MYYGMDAVSGRRISGIDHLRQSVGKVLTTPPVARVMRRDFGSALPELIDHPGHGANLLRLYSAAIDALIRWEPRILPTRCQLGGGELADGQFIIDIDAIALVEIDAIQPGQGITLSIPLGEHAS